jgi:hypothetical protein
MNELLSDPDARRRVFALKVLAGITILMSIALLLIPVPGPARTNQGDPDGSVRIGRAVDALFLRYGIDMSGVTTWRVTTPDRRFSRMEQRVFVTPRFLSLQFNHDLASLIAPAGARVIGTERAKEQIVTLHIVSGGLTIRSIAFVTRVGDEG